MDSSACATRLEKGERGAAELQANIAMLSAQQKWSIKVLMALVLLACHHNSIHVRSYLLRAALVPPSLSPWLKLYDKGDSSSFLHITGLM
jgi:hypothetical protein